MSEQPRFKTIERISYSSLVDFSFCGKYYKLVHLDKLKTFKGSVDTHFGTLLHKYVQAVLLDKFEIPYAAKRFEEIWERYCSWHKVDKKYKAWGKVGEKIIQYIKGFLFSKFGKYTVKHVEYKIEHQLENFTQRFKGYIDLVLELENGDIVIVDIKTAGSAFFFNRYRDKIKDYQITLYKKFYGEIEKIEADKISTVFLVFEKDVESKSPIVLIPVGSGEVKISNAEDWLRLSLININKNLFIKNKTSCLKFGEKHACQFFKSDHCPK